MNEVYLHRHINAKYAVFVFTDAKLAIEYGLIFTNLLLLKEKLYTLQAGLQMPKNHFMTETIEEIFPRLISGGIIQYLKEYSLWVTKFKRHSLKKFKKTPKQFKFSDLSYGFAIWLSACGVCCLAFSFELMMRGRSLNLREKIVEKLKDLIGLVLFVRFIGDFVVRNLHLA